MENCTIYSHNLNFEKIVQIVKSNLPKAKIELIEEGIDKSLIATLKEGFFSKTKTLEIKYRERQNPSYTLANIECALTQNLSGMVNFIQSLPAKNEEVRNLFVYKVMSTNCEIPFLAKSGINDEFESILRTIVKELDGFIFSEPNSLFDQSNTQHFVDKNLDLILDLNGNSNIQDLVVAIDAKYHDQPPEDNSTEQLERKAQSETFLKEKGIKINQHLPCIPSVAQSELRTVQEVIDRAYALLITAVKGEGIEQEHLEKAVEEKKINTFSPKETMIYKAEALNDQDRAYASWRYESLYTILWALGKMDELKYPSGICDVEAIVGKIYEPTREEFENSVKLRDIEEILDELDKTYRMNWACVDSRIKGQEVSGNLNQSVVYERHYSLNWLANHENEDWDDVQTGT